MYKYKVKNKQVLAKIIQLYRASRYHVNRSRYYTVYIIASNVFDLSIKLALKRCKIKEKAIHSGTNTHYIDITLTFV